MTPTSRPSPNSPLRIGLITGEYPPMQGGVGAYTRELALALIEQRHAVYVLADPAARTDKDQPNGDGIQVSTVPSWTRALLGGAQRWARDNRLDVVNVQYEAAAFRTAPLIHWWPRFGPHVPLVTTYHDLLVPYLFPKAGPLRRRALLTLARRSAGVVVTNPQDAAQLQDAAPSDRPASWLRTIPIGSNIRAQTPPGYDRAAWRAQFGPDIGAETFLIGYFGFMNATKGVDTLLEGIAALPADSSQNVHLLLIGGRTGSSDPTNAAYADQIDGLIARLGLSERVHWTGFTDDAQVSGHLLACDVLALPYLDGVSYRRGSFMAALAHGCAIITTTPAVPLPEIQDGGNVCLIPPGQSAVLAAALGTLRQDGDLRRRLGDGARALAGLFTWDRIAQQTATFYRELTGDRSG